MAERVAAGGAAAFCSAGAAAAGGGGAPASAGGAAAGGGGASGCAGSASAGAVASSSSAMIAMRAMRLNDADGVPVRPQNSSAGAAREA